MSAILNPAQRQCLHRAHAELIELYVDARDGKPMPQAQLTARLEAISEQLQPAVHVARSLDADGQMPALTTEELAAIELVNHSIAGEDVCCLLLAALENVEPDAEISMPCGPLWRLLEGTSEALRAARLIAKRLRTVTSEAQP